jgi:tRNA pseudouridine55 synthase
LLSYNIPDIIVRILCSKGTYIRSFARDIGFALGSGAYLSALRRTAIGPYLVKSALTIEKFEKYLNDLKQI